jgi:hypothetical protein
VTNNPKNRQQWIFDLLKVESLNYVETWAKYGQTWAKGKTTFDKDWNIANERANEYHKKANDAKDNASIATEVKAVKSGLKSKLDRQLKLQKQIEELEKLLIHNKVWDYFINEGESHSYQRDLLPAEISSYHKTLSGLHAELSKMGGDYAPAKVANVDEDGKVVKQILSTTDAISLLKSYGGK